jgi:hypothetical protein
VVFHASFFIRVQSGGGPPPRRWREIHGSQVRVASWIAPVHWRFSNDVHRLANFLENGSLEAWAKPEAFAAKSDCL